jgi:hypothetical protein
MVACFVGLPLGFNCLLLSYLDALFSLGGLLSCCRRDLLRS